MAKALSPTMAVREFENGYWYLTQLKNFAQRIGIPAAKKLRKDELEKAIVAFLRSLPPVKNKVPGPFGPTETPTGYVMKIVPPGAK